MVAERDRGGGRRAEILAAAERAFNRHGYAATTVEAVAVEAGISKGSIYNYFQSKEDLFQQVFARVAAGAQSDLAEITQAGLSASEKLGRVLDYWYERLEHHLGIGQLVLECWAAAARDRGPGGLAEVLPATYSQFRELFASILAEGVDGGQFHSDLSPAEMATIILGTLDGLLLDAILGIGVRVDASLLAAVKRSILSALGAGPDGREPTGETS